MTEQTSLTNATNATKHLVLFGISDRGLQRENNEDHFMVVNLTRKVIGVRDNQLGPELLHHEIGARGTILLVADGLGGHEGGEIASLLAVDTIAQTLLEMADQAVPVAEQLVHAVDAAHEAICKYHGAKGRTRHMASTLTAVHVGPEVMTIAQVGDSRAYRLSAGKLTLLTEDQTVVHMMQKKGMLTAEEAQTHPHRNIILQALGQDKAVYPELQTLSFQHNDCLLLCSDGLSSYVEQAQIEAIMASDEDEQVRCRRLVEAANGVGGADNVTVLLARIMVKDGRRPTRPVERPGGQQAAERVSQDLWTADLPLPQPSTSLAGVEPRPAEKKARGAWTLMMRSPWRTQEPQALPEPPGGLVPPASSAPGPEPASPQPSPTPPDSESEAAARPPVVAASEPPKVSIWRREIKWPWSKTAAPAPSPTFSGVEASLWDPEVIKALETHLARYIGPVSRVLVARAMPRAKDIPELCQALAAQLPTTQERDSFLQSVSQYNPARSRPS